MPPSPSIVRGAGDEGDDGRRALTRTADSTWLETTKAAPTQCPFEMTEGTKRERSSLVDRLAFQTIHDHEAHFGHVFD